MVRQLAELEAALQQQVAEHRKLLGLVEAQYAAMRAMDLAALDAAMNAQEACRLRIATLEAKRRGVVQLIGRGAKVEGPVTLYSDAYYAGSVQGIQAGFYSGPQLGYMAKKLSSLRVAPGWTVTLYSGNDFFGTTRVITADTNWLNDFNDQTGSIKVEGPNL